MQKLDENSLENVAGGYIFDATGVTGADTDYPWEIIDDNNGDVIGRFSGYDAAVAEAKRMKKDTTVIDWTKVQQLRSPAH